jgi:chromosomal replication initiator protein DnaA
MANAKGANRKLGELLIHEEMITHEQLDEALREKQASNRFLGEILVDLCYISSEELIGFLVRQCRIPHLQLGNFMVSPEISELIPAEICEEYKLLPIDKLGSLLTVAMVNPIDVEALEKVKTAAEFRIKPILCSWGDFTNLFESMYGGAKGKLSRGIEEIPMLGEEAPKKPEAEAPKTQEPVAKEKPAEKKQEATGASTHQEPPAQSPNENKAVDKAEENPDASKGKAAGYAEGLIERFTFDTYVVAEVNSFTYALARSVAESPGAEYNPLFIYGNTGLGKTHLSNAIGNEIGLSNGGARIVYTPVSRFIEELLHAVEHDHLSEFRESYGNVDVLILDDVQFLSGRTQAQQEFFNIFNDLYTREKQVILASDVPPKELEGLEQRLISRFEGGVVACLEAPDYETRLMILKKRGEEAGEEIPAEVLELLANANQSNVRELEGALKKLVAYSSLVGHEITVELAQEMLKHMFKAVAS